MHQTIFSLSNFLRSGFRLRKSVVSIKAPIAIMRFISFLVPIFLANIFKELYDEKPLSWKTSNYMGLEFLSRLEDNPEQIDEILNDIMRYASSSTKVSSQFIKIS